MNIYCSYVQESVCLILQNLAELFSVYKAEMASDGSGLLWSELFLLKISQIEV